jgi:hypothetical protein
MRFILFEISDVLFEKVITFKITIIKSFDLLFESHCALLQLANKKLIKVKLIRLK